MSKSIARHRHNAYIAQSGRCYYCGCMMWEQDPQSFSAAHNLSLNRARWLQCTAEHLIARQDGGKDTAANIVAACLFCNGGRHRIARAPSPIDFRKRVQARLSRGKWNSALTAATRLQKSNTQKSAVPS